MPAIIVNGTTYAGGLEWVNTTDPQAIARRAAPGGHKLYAPAGLAGAPCLRVGESSDSESRLRQAGDMAGW